jgi:hypothetical protein
MSIKDTPNIVENTPPGNTERMVEFIVQNSICYNKSERYDLDLGRNYKEYSDLGVIVCNSYGNYISQMMDSFVHRPADVVDIEKIESCIRDDFEILEILCRSKSDDVLTAVVTGIFEALVDSENELAVGAILANLGPHAQVLWDAHIPGITAREIKGSEEFQVIKAKKYRTASEFNIMNWKKV